MKLRPLFLMLLILLLVFSLSNSLFAQNATSGGLTGVVTDPSEAVVPDANVELRDNAKGISQTKSTNADGGYSILLSGAGQLHADGQTSRFPTRQSNTGRQPRATEHAKRPARNCWGQQPP